MREYMICKEDSEWVNVEIVAQGENTLSNYVGEDDCTGESRYDVTGVIRLDGRYYPARLGVGSFYGVTDAIIDLDDGYDTVAEMEAAENAAIEGVA